MARQFFTYVSPQYAKVGFTFVQKELPSTCKGCEYAKKCQLEPNRVYKVVEVRGGYPYCRLLHSNLVGVVVEEAEIDVCIDSELAEATSIDAFTPINCERVTCPYYPFCTPIGIKAEESCVILEVKESVKCPKGLSLSLVTVRRTSR